MEEQYYYVVIHMDYYREDPQDGITPMKVLCSQITPTSVLHKKIKMALTMTSIT